MTTTTWAACWPSCWRGEGRRVTLVTPARARVGVDGEHDGAGPHPAPAAGAGRRDPNDARGRWSAAPASCCWAVRIPSASSELGCDALVLVTARDPRDGLVDRTAAGRRRAAVRAIGDAWCPATIAAAVWDGHRYAEQLEQQDDREPPFLREVVRLADQPAETSAYQLGLVVIAQMAISRIAIDRSAQARRGLGQLADARARPRSPHAPGWPGSVAMTRKIRLLSAVAVAPADPGRVRLPLT